MACEKLNQFFRELRNWKEKNDELEAKKVEYKAQSCWGYVVGTEIHHFHEISQFPMVKKKKQLEAYTYMTHFFLSST